jgi:hypothetical protein
MSAIRPHLVPANSTCESRDRHASSSPHFYILRSGAPRPSLKGWTVNVGRLGPPPTSTSTCTPRAGSAISASPSAPARSRRSARSSTKRATTEMRYPTRESEFDHRHLQVPPSPLHDLSPRPSANMAARARSIARSALDQGHQSPLAPLRHANYRLACIPSLRPDQNWNRFRCGGFAFPVVVGQGQQWIGFRVVGADRPLRDGVGQYFETAYQPFPSIAGERFDLDERVGLNPSCLHVNLIHENHHPAAEHSAIPVVQSIDCRVVLVVASKGRQSQHGRVVDGRILRDAFENQKIRATRGRIPHPITWRGRKMESPWLTYPAVEVAEQRGKNVFNPVADQIVVLFESRPINYSVVE